MENIERPFDLLNKRRVEKKSVIVTLRNDDEYFGNIITFDMNINLVLATQEEGTLFIKGSEIRTIA